MKLFNDIHEEGTVSDPWRRSCRLRP
jgi:hypothetical protein